MRDDAFDRLRSLARKRPMEQQPVDLNELVAGVLRLVSADALRRRVGRPTALREIARAFLAGAGATFPGELARVTGLSRPDAGLVNRALVAEGYATTPARGEYRLRELDPG